MAKMKKIVIANCPEKFKIFDFANFSRIPLCLRGFIYKLQFLTDFELTGSTKM